MKSVETLSAISFTLSLKNLSKDIAELNNEQQSAAMIANHGFGLIFMKGLFNMPTIPTLFEVIVVATMSAGKSTVINALIGQELLHSGNEATTATITRIHDKDNLKKFTGSAYGYQNELIDRQETVDADVLKSWNADKSIKNIDLHGNIKAIRNIGQCEIVIYDTPGPNNSQDNSHEDLTMKIISDDQYGLILYVLNATQLGVNDDKGLLESICQSLQHNKQKKIMFLLNKSDQIDEEKGETLKNTVINAYQYLSDIGFVNPQIIPVSAYFALLANKVLQKSKLTRKERADLVYEAFTLDDRFIINAVISPVLKRKVLNLNKEISRKQGVSRNSGYYTKKELRRLYARSGFKLVSMILQKNLFH